ncbi:MAG: hypothetical protein KDC53_20065, partial [Saprospiraceae bacterium]|nr:hypothetical protein [Saprospiraceae bacterium]
MIFILNDSYSNLKNMLLKTFCKNSMPVFLSIFISQTLMAQLTIEKIMMGPEFVGHLPQQARWNDNSDKIYFEWDQDSVPGEESFQYSLQDLKLERMDIEEIKDVPPSSGIYSNDFKQKLYSKNGDLFLYENHQE